MTTAITFSRQNDTCSRPSNTQYWENLVLVVVLVLESKGLYFKAYVHTITLFLYLCVIIFISILLQYFLACLWLK